MNDEARRTKTETRCILEAERNVRAPRQNENRGFSQACFALMAALLYSAARMKHVIEEATAPPLIDRSWSGTTRFMSSSIVLPKP